MNPIERRTERLKERLEVLNEVRAFIEGLRVTAEREAKHAQARSDPEGFSICEELADTLGGVVRELDQRIAATARNLRGGR